jgi:hypothetical protein
MTSRSEAPSWSRSVAQVTPATASEASFPVPRLSTGQMSSCWPQRMGQVRPVPVGLCRVAPRHVAGVASSRVDGRQGHVAGAPAWWPPATISGCVWAAERSARAGARRRVAAGSVGRRSPTRAIPSAVACCVNSGETEAAICLPDQPRHGADGSIARAAFLSRPTTPVPSARTRLLFTPGPPSKYPATIEITTNSKVATIAPAPNRESTFLKFSASISISSSSSARLIVDICAIADCRAWAAPSLRSPAAPIVVCPPDLTRTNPAHHGLPHGRRRAEKAVRRCPERDVVPMVQVRIPAAEHRTPGRVPGPRVRRRDGHDHRVGPARGTTPVVMTIPV